MIVHQILLVVIIVVRSIEIESGTDESLANPLNLQTLTNQGMFQLLITFRHQFSTIPQLLVGIRSMGFNYTLPTYGEVYANQVTTSGFQMNYKSDMSSQFTLLSSFWMACINDNFTLQQYKIVTPVVQFVVDPTSTCLVFLKGFTLVSSTQTLGLNLTCSMLDGTIKALVQPGTLFATLNVDLLIIKSTLAANYTIQPFQWQDLELQLNEDTIMSLPLPQGAMTTYFLMGFSGFSALSNQHVSLEIQAATVKFGLFEALIGVGPNSMSYQLAINGILISIMKDCPSNCNLCLYSYTNCVQCDEQNNFFLNRVSRVCECVYGYFEQMGACIQCNNMCETCAKDRSNCVTCKPEGHRVLVGTICVCVSGFYENSATCQACDINCYACEQTAVRCISCLPSSNRALNKIQKVCKCKDTYFETLAKQCQSCSQYCITCVDDKYCEICIIGTLAHLNHNHGCECSDGYFNGTTKCEQCNFYCATCNSTQCLTCRFNLTILPQCTCSDNEISLSDGTCQRIILYPDLGYTATQELRQANASSGLQLVIDLLIDVPDQLTYQINVTYHQLVAFIAKNTQIYYNIDEIPQRFYPANKDAIIEPIFIQSVMISHVNQKISYTLNSTKLVLKPLIVVVPIHPDCTFSPINTTIPFEFVLDFNKVKIPPAQLQVMQSFQVVELSMKTSGGLTKTIQIFQYLGVMSMLVNSPQALGQLNFLDGLEPLNVYLTQVIVGKFAFRCEFGDWSYNGLQPQSYELLWKVNTTKVVMEDIHSVPKFRKAKVTNNFLQNTIIEQTIIFLLVMTTFLVRFLDRKKTYFHMQDIEEDQEGDEVKDVKKAIKKKNESRTTFRRNIGLLKTVLSFKVQSILFILNESYLAWIMISMLMEMKYPTLGAGSLFGRFSFAYAFLYMSGFVYMYATVFYEMNIFYDLRQSLTDKIQTLRSKQAHQVMTKINSEDDDGTSHSLQIYQKEMNHIVTMFMMRYSYFVRNTAMPTKYHFFASPLFLIKKVLFSFIVVFLYGQVYVQLSCMMIICGASLIYKILFNPYNDRFEHIFASLSDLMFIAALGSKFQDYKLYTQIFESGSADLKAIEIWIQKGWITVAFELACVFFNLTIIFGELLMNIREVGEWARARCGLLWYGDDDQEDQDFYKKNKKKAQAQALSRHFQFHKMNHLQPHDHDGDTPRALTSGMQKQIYFVGQYFKFIVHYQFKAPTINNEGYGQYVLKFQNLYEESHKFFILKDLKYKLTNELLWMSYPEKTILLKNIKDRQIQLSFSLPYQLKSHDRDDRVMEVEFQLSENTTVYAKDFAGQQLIDKIVRIILQANLTKVIQLLQQDEYDAQWYTGQNLKVLISSIEGQVDPVKVEDFWNNQAFIQIFNIERNFYFYLGKYIFHYMFEDNLQSCEIYVNMRLMPVEEHHSIQITMEHDDNLDDQHIPIVNLIATQFKQCILSYLTDKQQIEETAHQIEFFLQI